MLPERQKGKGERITWKINHFWIWKKSTRQQCISFSRNIHVLHLPHSFSSSCFRHRGRLAEAAPHSSGWPLPTHGLPAVLSPNTSLYYKEHELPQPLWMSSKPSSSAQRELEPGPARRIWRAARLLSHRRHQSHPLPGLQVLLLPINSYSKPQSSPWTKTHSPASLINTNGNCPPRHLPQYDIQRKCKGVVQFILIYALD